MEGHVNLPPQRTEIIIYAEHTRKVYGDKGRRIQELTTEVRQRFNFHANSAELYVEQC